MSLVVFKVSCILQENALFKSYHEKDKAELEEAVNKMAASQEAFEKKTSELRAQQRDNEELKKQLEKLAQERDLFKMKAEESQVKTVEEGKVRTKKINMNRTLNNWKFKV